MTGRKIAVAVLLIFATSIARVAEAKTVTLKEADNRTDVFLNLGDTLVVELSSGDVNGFGWVLHLPKGSGLTELGGEPAAGKGSNAAEKVKQFRFNAAAVGDTAVAFGFETPEKVPGAAPQDTSAYSARVHVALGSPRVGTAVLLGVYKGTLPCADCEGLDTTLRIYAKGRFDFTYAFFVRTQTYRGAPKGDVTFSDRGDWAMLRGDATDENATVYQLNPDDEKRSESYLLDDGGNALVMLDKEQRPIESTANLTLRKIGAAQPAAKP
ncbi:MAG: copper resistance protein NlpE [Edaphobacter sp.]